MPIHLEVLTHRYVNLTDPIPQNPYSYIPKIRIFHFCEEAMMKFTKSGYHTMLTDYG